MHTLYSVMDGVPLFIILTRFSDCRQNAITRIVECFLDALHGSARHTHVQYNRHPSPFTFECHQ